MDEKNVDKIMMEKMILFPYKKTHLTSLSPISGKTTTKIAEFNVESVS